MTKPSVIFMGTPDFAAHVLQGLLEADYPIKAVYTAPPHRARRGQRIHETPVHVMAKKATLPVMTPTDLTSNDVQCAFRDWQADMAVVVAYGFLLPTAILTATRVGAINVHASVLPRWRGAAPIQRAILEGDKETGVSLMHMDEGLDTGPVYATHTVPIHDHTTGGDLHDRLAAVGRAMCLEYLPDIAQNKNGGIKTPEPQRDAGATYAHKISPAEAELDWTRGADALARAVRAFCPRPGCWFSNLATGERIKVHEARALPASCLHVGEVGVEQETGYPIIGCAEGALVLTVLQRAGKQRQDADVFMRGYTLPGNVMAP